MSLWVAFRKEWMEQGRSYHLLVTCIVLIFFGLTSPVLAKFTPELIAAIPTPGVTIQMASPTVADAVGQYLKNVQQFGIVLALLLTMGVVAREKERGTVAMMLVKPMRRSTFLGGKFLGLAAIFACGLILAAIGGYYYTYLLFEPVDILHWLILNVLIFVYLLVVVAVTFFCSTLTKSQIAAGGLAIVSMVIPGQIATLLGWGKYLPGELITWGARLMQGNTSASWIALGVSIGLIVMPLLAAWLVFIRQEL
jgi:ABC-2 type transport system permease protein